MDYNQKMFLNEEKTKLKIFYFNKTKPFSTRLELNNQNIEQVKTIKLLGTYITDDLKWKKNTHFLVKRAYSRMELLRQLTKFTKSREDKLQIYKVYIRSVLEQSSVVWNSSLTMKNEREMERVQKIAVRLIMGDQTDYKESLNVLKLTTLKERRNLLSGTFAKKCLANQKTKSLFVRNIKNHQIKLKTEPFQNQTHKNSQNEEISYYEHDKATKQTL